MSDPARVYALRIPVHWPPEASPVACSLASYQLLVGGYAEPIRRPCARWQAYYSEESRTAGIEENPVANALLRHVDSSHTNTLCGPVLVVGVDENGGVTDLAADVVEHAQALFESLPPAP